MNTKEIAESVLSEVGKAVIGKEAVLCQIMTAILSGGHILIDDIPGVGKTTIAVAFAKALGIGQTRMQFTPDVLPSDITGFSMYDKKTESFHYIPGAAMTNLFLADEINRASPKTQSALLEVMQEGRISVDGKTYEVPRPFIVMATQNPFGSSGTQELPESQVDRFMIRLTVGYPSSANELLILKRSPILSTGAVCAILNSESLLALQKQADDVHVDDTLYAYMVSISQASRTHKDIALGISPRGTMCLAQMTKAHALMCGREYAVPDDISAVAHCTLEHRLILTGEARFAGKTPESVLDSIIKSIPLPSIPEAD